VQGIGSAGCSLPERVGTVGTRGCGDEGVAETFVIAEDDQGAFYGRELVEVAEVDRPANRHLIGAGGVSDGAGDDDLRGGIIEIHLDHFFTGKGCYYCYQYHGGDAAAHVN